MRILYLLIEGRDRQSDRLIEIQAQEHEVTVIDLSKTGVPHDYNHVVDEIFAHDRVISW